jgi:hypothetical protein
MLKKIVNSGKKLRQMSLENFCENPERLLRIV